MAKLVQTYDGEPKTYQVVRSEGGIRKALRSMARGTRWGVVLRASVDELTRIGARRGADGKFALYLSAGVMLACEVSQ